MVAASGYTMVPEKNIGGAWVRRLFRSGDRVLKSGDRLTREQVLAIPFANRQALIAKNYLDVFPPSGETPAQPSERFVVRGDAKTFDVIEGRKIASGLTREAADMVANAAAEKPN